MRRGDVGMQTGKTKVRAMLAHVINYYVRLPSTSQTMQLVIKTRNLKQQKPQSQIYLLRAFIVLQHIFCQNASQK